MSERQSLGPCPLCGAALDFTFLRPLSEVANMRLNGEWISLEAFPVDIVCTKCTYKRLGTARNFTIDIKSYTILYGEIDEEK